jgi:uncharacterized membrane protein YhaH (DUF805 family)
MKKNFETLLFLILLAFVLPAQAMGHRRKRVRWSTVFLIVAILIFIVQVVYTAVTKGH